MTNWRSRSGSWWRRSAAEGDSDVTPPEEPDNPSAVLVDDALTSQNGHSADGPRTESFAVVGAGRSPLNGHEAVRLAYATRQEFSPGGGVSQSYTAVRVRVANLGYQKDVQLRWRAYDGWSESPLEWKATYGDHDVFASQIPSTAEFAVRYRVNDDEYWDNNGGGNYRLDSPGNSLVGGGVVLRRAELKALAGASELVVTGQIYVNDLTYQKQVGIKLSLAPGSWTDIPAHYVGLTSEETYFNIGNAQVWEFSSPPVSPAQNIRLAAYYHLPTQGRTLWDNNFGNDYELPNTPGRVVE